MHTAQGNRWRQRRHQSLILSDGFTFHHLLNPCTISAPCKRVVLGQDYHHRLLHRSSSSLLVYHAAKLHYAQQSPTTQLRRRKKKSTDKLGKSTRPQSGLLHFWKLLHSWYTEYMWYFDWSKEIWFLYLGLLKCFKIKFLNLKYVIPYLICNIPKTFKSKRTLQIYESWKTIKVFHRCITLQCCSFEYYYLAFLYLTWI